MTLYPAFNAKTTVKNNKSDFIAAIFSIGKVNWNQQLPDNFIS